jgi:hypothetical protein
MGQIASDFRGKPEQVIDVDPEFFTLAPAHPLDPEGLEGSGRQGDVFLGDDTVFDLRVVSGTIALG